MLYSVYDSATDRWFKRGDWTMPGKMTKLWRQKGQLKLSLIYYATVSKGIPPAHELERLIRAESPTMDWRKVRTEANKRMVLMLPETYQVFKYTEHGPEYVGTLKEWY